MSEFDFENNGDLDKVSEVLFNVFKQIIPDADKTKLKFSKIDSEHNTNLLYNYKYSSYSVKFTRIEKYWYIYCKTMVQSIDTLKCNLERTGYYFFDTETKKSTYFEEKFIMDETVPFIYERLQIILSDKFKIAQDGKNNLEELEKKARDEEKKKKEEEEKKEAKLKEEEEKKRVQEKEEKEKRTVYISSTITFILDSDKDNSYIEKVIGKLVSKEISDEIKVKAEHSYGKYHNKELSVKINFNDENKYPFSNAEKIIDKVREKITFVMQANFEKIEYEKKELDSEKDVKVFIEKFQKAKNELLEIENELKQEYENENNLIDPVEIDEISEDDDVLNTEEYESSESVTFDELSVSNENTASSEKQDDEDKKFQKQLDSYLNQINESVPFVEKTEYITADETQKRYHKLKKWMEKNSLEIIGDIDIFLNDFCFAFRKGSLRNLSTAQIKTMFETEDFNVKEVSSREMTTIDLYNVVKHRDGAWLKEAEDFEFFYVRVSSDSLFFLSDYLGVY